MESTTAHRRKVLTPIRGPPVYPPLRVPTLRQPLVRERRVTSALSGPSPYPGSCKGPRFREVIRIAAISWQAGEKARAPLVHALPTQKVHS